ncbi:peroxidase 64-like protein [Tanacetum coccineum]
MSALLTSLLIFSFFSLGTSLSSNYYAKTCPNVESLIRKAVRDAATSDKKVPAALLRMHFHDCFIRGCDASVLLDSKGKNTAEKDGPPNVSLHSFYVIDNAKKAVESACPGIVSCADILALAARDAVVLSGGPSWDVPKGRKDGRTSKASETIQLPAPTFNISQLQQSFAQRGLSLEDLVALSGGHTLGFSHCSSFKNRIHNFNSTTDVDPSIHPSFAASLRSTCPAKNNAKNAGVPMDPSSTSFDNTYYKLIFQQKALFSSDKALLDSPKTKNLAMKFASSKDAFTKAFIKSMIKMSSITGGQEVRKDLEKVKALGANGDMSGSRVGVVWMEVGGGIVRARVVSRVVLGLVSVLGKFLGGFWVDELALEAMEFGD